MGSRRHQMRAPSLPGRVVDVDEDEGRRRRHAVGGPFEEPDHLIRRVVPYPPNQQKRGLEAENHNLDQDAEHNRERQLERVRMMRLTPLQRLYRRTHFPESSSAALQQAGGGRGPLSPEQSYNSGIRGATGLMEWSWTSERLSQGPPAPAAAPAFVGRSSNRNSTQPWSQRSDRRVGAGSKSHGALSSTGC